MKKILLSVLLLTGAMLRAVVAEPIEEIFICPGETVTVLENNIYKAPWSDNICNRGTRITANTSQDPNYPNNEPFTSIVPERIGDRYSKVTLNWKSDWTGTVSVTVFGNGRYYKGVIKKCESTGEKAVITYKITRKSPAPGGMLAGNNQYTLGSDGAVTDVKYTGKAIQVRYRVNGGTTKTITPERSRDLIRTSALPFTAATEGTYTFVVEELNSCGDWSGNLSKTVYVSASCAGDDPDNIAFGISGSGVQVLDEGYRVNQGKSYSINISGVTDFDDNYTLSHNGGSDITLSNQSFTINAEVGSYRIEATPVAGRSGCTILNPIKVFVGGQDRVFPAQGFYNCPIVLPDPAVLTELGYETDEYQNFILQHFSLTLKSKRGVIIKPGIILENGAQLIVEGSKIEADPTDPDLNVTNFIEQTAYDEYGDVFSQGRAYLDERGRPVQSQYKNLSKNRVMASATLYDAYGRPVISTLSAPIKSNESDDTVDECGQVIAGQDVAFVYQPDFVRDANNGAYDNTDFDLGSDTNLEDNPDPVGGNEEGTLGWYYSDQNNVEEGVAITEYPYSRMLYHRDGSGEIKGTALPGDYHRAGSGHVATMNTVEVDDNDTYLGDYFSKRATATGLPSLTTYAGLFFKREATDVNGYRTVAYLDQSEQALMTLYFGDQATPITTSHQYYNYRGQLVAAKDPNDHITRYTYDIHGRLVEMKEPDAGITQYMYRKDGSIRFSQNAEQRVATPARFSYTNYDRSGRAVESGEYSGTDKPFGSQALKDLLENTVAYQPSTLRYSEDDLAVASKQDRVLTYYDGGNPDSGYPQQFVQGSVSYSEKPGTSKTWYSYDAQGRMTEMVQEIGGLPGKKRLQYTYGHQGSVSLIAYQADQTDAFYHHYQYNEDGQLERVYVATQAPVYSEQGDVTNTDDYQLQASYEYYLHGPLKRVKLAGSTDEEGQVTGELQATDYYYTVQGWLKAINNPAAPGSDVFSMQLDYFAGDYSSNGSGIKNLPVANVDYSGNIQTQQWRTVRPDIAGGIVHSSYQYEYDQRYQIKSASFSNVVNGDLAGQGNKYKLAGLSYDANGNIETLQRYREGTLPEHDFTGEQGKYHYEPGTNQLKSVGGYASYRYNQIGQMVEQKNLAGSTAKTQYVKYDVSGKAVAVYGDAKEVGSQWQYTEGSVKYRYTYDDKGYRSSTTDYTNVEGNSVTYYVRDASGSILSVYQQGAGESEVKAAEVPVYGSSRIGLYQRVDATVDYELKDHLGNVRAIVGEKDEQADVKYYADYYPFGSVMRSTQSGNNRYLYQGEYAEYDGETGWHHFELRSYDAVIGRWLSVDPYGQYASPYVGMGNDPVNGVDPDGGFKTKFGAWFYNVTHGGGGEIQYGLDKDEWFVGSDMANTLANGEITVNYQRVFQASNSNLAGSTLNNFDYGLDYTRDFAAGVNDFVNVYYEMREANWVNSDKYFHSKANFRATVRGDGGRYAAEKMSNLREIVDQRVKRDPREASLADQEANRYGREQAKHHKVHQLPGMNYKEAIPKYRPANLPGKY